VTQGSSKANSRSSQQADCSHNQSTSIVQHLGHQGKSSTHWQFTTSQDKAYQSEQVRPTEDKQSEQHWSVRDIVEQLQRVQQAQRQRGNQESNIDFPFWRKVPSQTRKGAVGGQSLSIRGIGKAQGELASTGRQVVALYYTYIPTSILFIKTKFLPHQFSSLQFSPSVLVGHCWAGGGMVLEAGARSREERADRKDTATTTHEHITVLRGPCSP